MKKVMKFFFGADLWKSRFGIMAATTFATMLWFVIDWCMGSTFRSMSMWLLYVNNLLAAALLMLPFMLSRHVWVQTLWLMLVDILLMANLMYFRTYFAGIPPESYLLAGNLADFTASVWDMLRWRDIVFALILASGAYCACRIPATTPRRLWWRYFSIVALLAAISGTGMACKGGFYKMYDRLFHVAYSSSCGVPAYTVAGHVAYHLMNSSKSSDPSIGPAIDAWLSDHRTMMPATALPDSIQPRKNLVIILLESFESWPLEKKLGGKEITPYLNSLLADSTTFYAPETVTQTDVGRSIDGQLLITAGLLPAIGSVYSTQFPGSTYLTLNKALKERYDAKSMLLTVDQFITWNMGVISQAFGYDRLLDRDSWNNDEKIGSSRKLSDGSFFRQSVQKLSEGLWPEGEPAMLTFVTYSGHGPWRLPDNLKDPDFDITGLGIHDTTLRYCQMAHYTDAQLRTIIEYLKSRSDWPETLVLITGDHEGLATERADIVGHSDIDRNLVDAGQHTPMILLNSPIGARYMEQLGQVDIYPTLLTLLGLHDYKWPGLGQSVFAPDKIPAAISSMTKELSGDTTGIDPARLQHWQQARKISDHIIRTDYLRKL